MGETRRIIVRARTYMCLSVAIVENAGCMGINFAIAAGAAASSIRSALYIFIISQKLIVLRYWFPRSAAEPSCDRNKGTSPITRILKDTTS